MHEREVLTMRTVYIQMVRICLILLSLSWVNLCLAWPWQKLWNEKKTEREDSPWEKLLPHALYEASEPQKQLDTGLPLGDIDFSTMELEELYPYKRTSIHSKLLHFGLNGKEPQRRKRPGMFGLDNFDFAVSTLDRNRMRGGGKIRGKDREFMRVRQRVRPTPPVVVESNPGRMSTNLRTSDLGAMLERMLEKGR